MKDLYNVAIAGATGTVGTTLLAILEERKFPIDKLFLLASERSVGDALDFNGKSYSIEALADFDFTQTEICFFCTANDISAEYAPKAAKFGNVVIDKSSQFRYDKDVPLIVPEVNSDALNGFRKKNIIANPNCNTIPVVMALKPIYDAAGISRMNIATYQSVSGSGKEAISELAEQTALLLNGKPIKPKVYSQQIAFNILPQCDELQENGYTREEMKIVWETQKILNDKKILINPTAARVPVFFGHSAAVHIETKDKISLKEALDLLANAPGIKLMTGKNQYPTPVRDATGKDEVFIGRVREDISHKKGLDMWVVTDNLRKGAALNAVQIAEELIENYL
jgi:aspartate-semialdehyde dehydrogenase